MSRRRQKYRFEIYAAEAYVSGDGVFRLGFVGAVCLVEKRGANTK